MADSPTKSKEILLNGKLITSRDAATIGDNNFQALTNLRYTDTHPKGIGGMTKINTNALTNAKIRSGYHFRKDDPQESHVLVQSFNAGETQGYIYENTTAVPTAGDFSGTVVLTQDSTAGTAQWSSAPNGYVAMCDKAGAYVWGGAEAEISSFITSTAAITDSITNAKEFVHEVRNTLATNEESAVIGGGNDSDTVLLLHCNGDDAEAVVIEDSSSGGPGGNADTVGGNAQLDIDQAKFGQSSLLLDGTGDYVSWNDNAAWNFGANPFEIDTWVRFSSVSGLMSLYTQATAYGYVALFVDHDNNKLHLKVTNTSGVAVVTESATWNPSADTWYHVAVIRGWGGSDNSWAFVVDGSSIGTFTNSGTMPDIAAAFRIGAIISTSYVDFGATGYGFTTAVNATVSSTEKKYGDASLYLDDGNNSQIVSPSTTAFNPTTNWTVDFWVKHSNHAGDETYFFYREDDNNRIWCKHIHGSGIYLEVKIGGVLQVAVTGTEITDTDWHHVAVCKVGSDWGVYLDGTQISDDDYSYGSTLTGVFRIGGTNAAAQDFFGYIDDFRIQETNAFSAAPVAGLTDTITAPSAAHTSDDDTRLLYNFNTMDLAGWIDEFRISKGKARWTANFSVPTRPYSTTAPYFLVGSVLPLKGVKLYILNANTQTSTLTVKEWNGYSWNALTATDNTSSGGVSLAQTGTVTWATTENTARVKYLNGTVLYWYQFYLSAGDADIYYVTMDAPMQTPKDLWNGISRECLAFFHVDNGDYLDYSVNIYDDSYDSTNTATYAALDSLVVADDYLLVGFNERMMGLNVSIVKSNNDGVAGNIGLTMKYWNGTGWATASGMTDETATNSRSFDQTGVITWTPPDRDEEFRTDIQTGIPLYYYKLEFDTTNFGNEVEVYFLSGIPAPIDIHSFGFPVHAGSALWLLSDQDEKKNRILRCAPHTISFWNGDEALEIEVGDDSELTAGASSYIQLGSNLYEVILLCKRHETWMLVPGTETIQKFRISDKIGCVAPSTMKACHLGSLESGSGKSIIMWQGAEGIYLFDGKSPLKVSEDIDDLFDKRDSTGLNRTYIEDSFGEFDVEAWEYRWLCRTGTSANWDEYVYDLRRGKWYHVDRGTGKALKCAISAVSTTGNYYTYGGIETGYLERLEFGNDFDSNDIVHTLKTADFVLNDGRVSRKSIIRNVKLVGGATNTTSNTISGSYFKDTNTSADETFTLTPQKTGKRLFQDGHSMGGEGNAVFHCFNFSMTTDNEAVGFEPMFLDIEYKDKGLDKGR